MSKKWNYREVFIGKGNEDARKNGCILEHRYVAEKILGRKLKDEEVVHHIDENRENNDKSNLIIFRSVSDHSRFHQTGNLTKLDDGTYISEIAYNICKQCGKETINDVFCSYECSSIGQRKFERPSKEELEILIKKYPFIHIGKMFNVSDNAIRKWCKYYNLPYRRKDLKQVE